MIIVCMIYGLSAYLITFDLDEIERANQGHWIFSGLYLIK